LYVTSHDEAQPPNNGNLGLISNLTTLSLSSLNAFVVEIFPISSTRERPQVSPGKSQFIALKAFFPVSLLHSLKSILLYSPVSSGPSFFISYFSSINILPQCDISIVLMTSLKTTWGTLET